MQDLWATLPRKGKKEPFKIKYRAHENPCLLQCKSLFKVADLGNEM